MKERLKSLVVPSMYALSLLFFVFSMYFVQKLLSNSLFKEKDVIEETEYVDSEIIENNEFGGFI